MTQAINSFQKIVKDGRVKQLAEPESRLVHDVIGGD